MTTDVKMYYKQGYNPLLLTQSKDAGKELTDIVKTKLNSCYVFDCEPSIYPLREKVVRTGQISETFNGGSVFAKKVITRLESETKNSTKIVDFAYEAAKGVELTRELPNGEILNLVMKKGKDGIGEVLKFTTSNGLGDDLTAVTKNFGKLDPLAKKWIKEALKYLF